MNFLLAINWDKQMLSISVEHDGLVEQWCINRGSQFAVASKLYTLATNICVYSVWNLLHVTF